MQKQKLFLTITTVIFITVFSIYNFEIYYNFHVNKINSITQKTELKNNILNFDPQKIKQISNIELHTTPSKDTLEKLLLLIESSKDQILIEMYIFTEKKILQALIKAKQR
jgi:phosphatidylserine/phosphatidylglycerophosphate/cardiolipin synthase-like enzyme